jgi:hypothetical protein
MDEQRKNPFRRTPRGPDAAGEPAPDAANAPASADRRDRKGIRQLPRDMQDLANGTIDRLPRPRREPSPLDDPREGAVIAGVRNAEARVVYDARVTALRAALAAGRQSELIEGLREVRQLALWRARNVTDFQAFAESVVGVPAGTSEALTKREDDAPEPAPIPVEAVALLIRVEAALLQRLPTGQVHLRSDPEGPGVSLTVTLPITDVGLAIEGLGDVGRGAAALRRFIRPDALPPPSDTRRYDEPDRSRRPARDGGGGGWNAQGPRRVQGRDAPRRDSAGGGPPARQRPPFRGRDDRPPPKRRRP